MSGLPQPYRVAILGAILAASLSGLLNYWLGKHDSPVPNEREQAAYRLFLERLNDRDAPQLTRLLSLANRISFLDKDIEIQDFEDQAESLLDGRGLEEILVQFNVATTPLKVYGTNEVRFILDDIAKALLLRDDDIDWPRYGTSLASRHASMREAQETGSAHGFEERISPDERLMIFSFALLSERLFNQLRSETACNTSTPCRNS